jgi:hypothetical protein
MGELAGIIVLEWLIALFSWVLIFGTLCYVWAGKKGLNKINWGIIGGLLGIIGVILLWGAKSKTDTKTG